MRPMRKPGAEGPHRTFFFCLITVPSSAASALSHRYPSPSPSGRWIGGLLSRLLLWRLVNKPSLCCKPGVSAHVGDCHSLRLCRHAPLSTGLCGAGLGGYAWLPSPVCFAPALWSGRVSASLCLSLLVCKVGRMKREA